MDPLSALSLAGTIIQFVDFGTKVLDEGYAIYKKRRSTIFEDVKIIVNDLQDFVARFQSSLNSAPSSTVSTDNDFALEQLCRRCITIATELIQRFEKIEALKDKGVKMKALRSMQAALVLVWSKKDIEETEETLASYRSAIQTRLLYGLRHDFNVSVLDESRRFDSLDRQMQNVFKGVLDTQKSADRDRDTQFQALAKLLSLTEIVIRNQDNATQRTVVDALKKTTQDRSFVEEYEAREALREQKDKISAVAEDLTRSLAFPSVTDRIDSVDDAHAKTFRWIFEEDDTKNNFAHWLKTGNGIYWINGKAGSGKTTLMKYIFQNPQTLGLLSQWASDLDSSANLTGFFFWAGGTLQQRSQEGLYRAVLVDILDRYPDLVPIVFPAQWAMLYQDNSRLRQIQEWTLPSLLKAFKNLLSQRTVPMKLCLLIDGLDEYDGDHASIAQLFQEVTETPFVKICVASRPLAVFLRAFAGRPCFRLQDLTQPDIEKYVNDVMKTNQDVLALLKEHPRDTENLMSEIVKAASGVFLWVVLVVKRLLRGLIDGDRIADLRMHIQALPPELDDLFELMVLKIDKSYYDQASRIFQLVEASIEQDDDWIHLCPLTIVSLTMADEEIQASQVTAEDPIWTEEQIGLKCQNMAARLKSRCGDLIEIQGNKSSLSTVPPDARVTYLHRTVRDFLNQQKIKAILVERTQGAYNPEVALIHSDILQLKNPSTMAHSIFEDAFAHTWRLQQKYMQTPRLLLDQLCKFPGGESFIFENMLSHGNSSNYTPLHAPIFFGIHRYVSEKLRESPGFQYGEMVSMLKYTLAVISRIIATSSGSTRCCSDYMPAFFSELFAQNIDPNTCWSELLRILNNRVPLYRPDEKHDGEHDEKHDWDWLIEVVKLFLKYGADPFTGLELEKSYRHTRLGKKIPNITSAADILERAFGYSDEYWGKDGIRMTLRKAKLKPSNCLQQ